ncbi:Nucleotide-diphospho-sugar transferases [Syntrophomonas zehnderi OL-4]|uniref:dolichyl-phosphate beta-glucosyltransferase n=1 Tax=Syntrophomonas zehnderi OL-4 TaxID=690567 RepID=A0A0E4C854_9FIRM|nr:glycosyltransferase [Syntrophomonas zehnderi]CFX26206.1 Nucleotide-diphospho-sugar transferases [Syntrophomonas zehnderi OL-4]
MLTQFTKFALTGLVNTLIDFGVFNFLVYLTGAQSPLGIGLINTLAVSLAMCNSFILNQNWTFPTSPDRKGQITRFITASLIGIAINSSTVALITALPILISQSPYLFLNGAKIMGAILSITWNFLTYRHWVFANREARTIFQPAGYQPGMVSIIIPAYNEEHRLPQRLRQLAPALLEHFLLEIVVVDDGSQDRTREIVEELTQQYPFIRYLQHKTNQGKGAAVRTGMCHAAGEYLIFTDADATFTPEHIIRLAKKLLQGDAAVIACRQGAVGKRVAGESLGRFLQGKAFNLLVQILLLPGIKDTQCGLKGFNQQVAAQIFPRQRIRGFAFDVELLALIKSLKLPTAQIAVTAKDCPGSTVHRILAPLTMARDILRIRLALFLNLYGLPDMVSLPKRLIPAGSLFILALLVRIPWLWEIPRYIDELKEVQLAYQIYQGQVLPLHNTAHDIGALHNYILAGIFKLAGVSVYWPRLYVAITSALTVVLFYYIAKKMFGHWVGMVAALLLLGNGMHILVTHMAWSNCTTPFFFCLAWLALGQAEEKKSGAWLILSGILWALTLQTHASAIIYVLAVSIYVLRPYFRCQTAIKTRYYWAAVICFLTAYSNMIYYNIVSRGGSLAWLRYKGYALEKDPGLMSYLKNTQNMFIDLVRSVSSTYAHQDIPWHYLGYPWFTLALLLLLLGAYRAFKSKKHLPLYILAASFLVLPWINARYSFFLSTRYIMPVILCALLMISLGLVHSCRQIYEFMGNKRNLTIPAYAALLLLVVVQIIPFYSYCAQKAGTNQSNRLALQVFQKAMELSDRRSTLVVLDKNLMLENDPLPYLLTIAEQPYLVSNTDLLVFSSSGAPALPADYQGKKVVGIVSASNYKTLKSQLSPQGIEAFSCQLTLHPTDKGERKVYVLDLGCSE